MIGSVLRAAGPVSVYCETPSLICHFYLSVAARTIVWTDPSQRYTSMLLGRLATYQHQHQRWVAWLLFVVCWLVDVPATCYSVSQGPICPNNCTCYHTEIEPADQTFYLTQLQYTDTRPTNPSTDPVTPGAWQGSYWSTNF